ncbi:MAG: efflux RND transporter periplasmic adaptor subunit [Deltaproteobacteria bacterium]|nr:efflux RND transporter periplasmic adaptor subunit [Deltaproteobacteria bacterium]
MNERKPEDSDGPSSPPSERSAAANRATSWQEKAKARVPMNPRALRRYAIVAAALLIAFAIGIGVGGSDSAPPETAQHNATAAEHDHTEQEAVWTCSMHPQIRMHEPGQCPICGMDLIPVATDDADDDEHASTKGELVKLSPRAVALAKIETVAVERATSRTELRLLGRIDYDETRIRTVTPWTAGRIDELRVRVTGERIRRNQVVATLYSPEIYSAMRDLVAAVDQAERLSGGLHGSADMAREALNATKERLRLLGVPNREIDSVIRTKNPPTHVSIRSPFTGTILERLVDEGQYVSAGTPLYRIADLSRVWVQIDAYETDLPHLRVGQDVLVKVEGLAGDPLTGRTTFIDPVLDERERTARVRVEVANPNGRLRPGMFAEAVIETDAVEGPAPLVIPESAPLFTGRRSVAFVEVPHASRPTYELRVVRLGPRTGPVYPVLAGLNEGERVVVQGAFVLDADLQLRGGGSMMTMSDDVSSAPPPAPPVSSAFRDALHPVVEAYLKAQKQLANDDLDAARDSLSSLAKHANEASPQGSRKAMDAWQRVASKLVGHARHGASSSDAGDVRNAFEYVSMQLSELLRLFGNPIDSPLRLAFCPMAFDAKGAEWIQRDGELENPYYGQTMLRCGDFRATVLPSERLGASVEPETPPPTPSGGHQH